MKNNMWKKAIFAMFLGVLPGAGAQADFDDDLLTYVKIRDTFMEMEGTWTPYAISVADGKAVILLEQPAISLDFVLTALPHGVCAYATEDDERYLRSVNEVAILNKRGDQGYIFNGSSDACKEIYGAQKEHSDALIRSRLHSHELQ